MAVDISRIDYRGWKDCIRLSNGAVELIVTTQVGPRIISFGFTGGPNEFAVFDEQAGLTGGDEWRIYGGHRLWHSPEKAVRTYNPDNSPIDAVETENGLLLRQPVEALTGIVKEMEIELSADEAHLTVIHRLTNDNLWGLELAPWALSVMAPGGTAIVPQPKHVDPEGFLPNRSLSIWPYTDMSDARITWGRDYLLLRQDSSVQGPFKFGINASDEWCAYANHGHLFVKLFDYVSEAFYPDYEASVECYTNDRMLELETVGPLVYLEPGGFIEHPEGWVLLPDIAAPADENDVRERIQPRLDGLLQG